MSSAEPAGVSGSLPLRDIHLPPTPGWWPPAPGWWLLAALILVLVAALYLLLQRNLRLRYRRQALRQLAALESDLQLPASALLAALSVLMRRAILCGFERESCAALSGDAWLDFLDQGLADAPFATGVGRCLAQGPYQPDCDFDRTALLALCRRRLQMLPARQRSRS